MQHFLNQLNELNMLDVLNENNETDRGRYIQHDEKSQATAYNTIDAIFAACLFLTDRFHCVRLHVI
jgi:hypothetical protein